MKKFIYLLALAVVFIGGCDNQKNPAEAQISPDKIYFFFSNGCPHCHDALAFINQKYPDLKVSMVNVGNNEGYELFVKCAAKFKLGRYIGTPLFCMGDKYLMGWSPESEILFDEYVQPFIK